MKKKGFTLIELIAVLVIMAIIALIVTPLVMSIIKKAKVSADKRSIDAYGRSIELAIAGYLMDNGTFPTSVEQLTIEYSGDEVVCSTTRLNSDSSVYLAGCTVGGRSVDGYTYGKESTEPTVRTYSVGDEVTYNNVAYRVIKDSDESDETVKLLKAEPLTVAEVNQYGGVGTANNHVNMYSSNDSSEAWYQTARDYNGYGGMVYYSSETCGYNTNGWWVDSGCKMDYADSEIKYVVDAWKTAQAPAATEARLITYEELETDLECTFGNCENSSYSSWVYNSNYKYWTMSSYDYNEVNIYVVDFFGYIDSDYLTDPEDAFGIGTYIVVRPVIVLPKSAISS